ncbi:3-deoxy-7-phosphoheptulonate synthase [Psychrilyobacter sp.]|uniref:3-deoxy-7-phosphoheptulonate synthase n=1 Tax=Psychrilyobacter sp. TaxID=2586924 RepID=UPI003017853C
MIIKLKKGATNDQVDHIVKVFENLGMEIKDISGREYGVLGIVGDTSKLSVRDMEALEGVEKVTRIQEPFKKANRKMQEECTIIDVNGIKIGGGNFTIMSGPCSVESRDQILEVARSVKKSGAQIMRGGAYKPRTSPYAFQGMELEGLELLKEAREETGMPIVTEIMSVDLVGKFVKDVDIIQVGARNMQNFDLLKALGKIDKPILLKRGLSATIEEWLMSAEYIMAGGNEKVILCERGIRTYEKYTRNTLDLSAVLAVKKLSHLPVIVDPSHATGKRWMVKKLAMAAAAVGADGLMIEVHNDPENALCDGAQSLRPEQFEDLVVDVKKILEVVGKKM